ncbi:MAG: hypothetical protein EBU66_19370 [Bacteroidetes bacterium]|nr:hypothetical protein [bacterium]NBP66795.1 hypothetical protein [Bacteroidota bacterium]
MGKVSYRTVGAAAVGSILFKGMLIEFVFDAMDLPEVKKHAWHFASGNYIATSVKVDVSGGEIKKREVYLHNFLLKPGPNQIAQHISKNGLDNRRENLRCVDACAATSGYAKKKRNVELPPMCGIKPEEIPKHVWYVQANGYHRDRFAIEFKTEGILWKSTSSKEVSLQEKLEQAVAKLKELYELYPYLDPKREEEEIAALAQSFQTILLTQSGPSETQR